MSLIFFFAAMLCLLGVVGTLFGGLFAMAKGGEKDRKTSNRMMRLRVVLQALAVLFLLFSYLSR